MKSAAMFAILAGAACAQQPAQYDVLRAPGPITIDARLDEPGWRKAPTMGPFHFNWYESGDKESTEARLLWDDQNLYVSWYCHDRHISASVTKRHGPVSNDDC